ncbi:MAG: DUF4038 domain-containing protein [Caldilineaceae bacterium]|nr:DUF4038 domain-containing protein [Caldilineaceae bacterium]
MQTFDTTLYVFETSFTSSTQYSAPIRDIVLTFTFTGPGGARAVVPGFWDGNDTWRVRFSPPAPGEWHYTSQASDASNAGLHGQSGTFAAPEYTGDLPLLAHGPIRASADGTHLIHADGTPFFWLADTAWNGVLKAPPADWDEYLAERRAQGFTAVQFVITQWRAFPQDAAGELAFTGTEDIRINPAFYHRFDDKVAAIARAGLVPSPVLVWACTPNDPGYYLSAADCTTLAAYEVARYAAYRPIWILGGDGEYRGEHSQKWKETGRAVFGDSGAEPVTMHPRGTSWPGEDLRDEKWLTFHSYQSGHGDSDETLRWLQSGPPAANWNIEPVKPVINQEPNYEHHLAYQSRRPISAVQVRRALYWSLLVSPTAGVTYGNHGIWPWMEEAGVPADHPNSGVAPTWREALQSEGAAGVRHLAALFAGLDWPSLRPAQQLLAQQPGDADPNRFIAAAQSADGPVVVYTPGDPIHLTRPLTDARWYDPRTGEWTNAGNGAEFTPSDGEDWVLIG